MLKQYNILNQCLTTLAKSELPLIQKLSLELKFYQLKRLLLVEEIAAMVKGDKESELEFQEMLHSLLEICGPATSTGKVQAFLASQTDLQKKLQAPHKLLRPLG